MYTKLFNSIIMSSIWSEDAPTCKLWITLLASADREGYVFGSPIGLAKVATLSLEQVTTGLQKLLSEDPQSADLHRNPTNKGRRIEVVDGGWKILNYTHYRDLQLADDRRADGAERKRNYRARKAEEAAKRVPSCPKMSPSVPNCPPSDSNAEADTDSREKRDPRRRAKRVTARETKNKNSEFADDSATFLAELPKPEEVAEFFRTSGFAADPTRYFDSRCATGWMKGSSRIRDWKADARSYDARWRENETRGNGKTGGSAPSGDRKAELLASVERQNQKVAETRRALEAQGRKAS